MNNGKIKIVGVTGKSVFGVNPETGKIEWTFRDWGRSPEDLAKGFESIAPNTPLYDNGRLFVCNGYNMGSFMLRLNERRCYESGSGMEERRSRYASRRFCVGGWRDLWL